MRHLRIAFLVFLTGFTFSACGSKKNSSGAPAQPSPSANYYEADGTCYRESNNQQTSSSNCDNLQYYIENGQCFDKNGASASLSKCTSNTYYFSNSRCYDRSGTEVNTSSCSGSASSGTEPCEGIHYYFDDDGQVYEVNCDGTAGGNCSPCNGQQNNSCVPYELFSEAYQSFVSCY